MFKRLSLYTLFLCFVPFFAWIMHWQWRNDMPLSTWDRALFWLTETGSTPYAIITCGVFSLLLLPFFRHKKQWGFAVVLMAVAVLLTQGVKSGLKQIFSEPRPYVVALTEQQQSSPEQFYDQSRLLRAQWVKQAYEPDPRVPQWLVAHHSKEVGYAFPSGHSIFAATWLLLVAGWLSLLKVRSLSGNILLMTTALWAALMLISRLRLGMHYPIDLLVSVLLAYVINGGLLHFFGRRLLNQSS